MQSLEYLGIVALVCLASEAVLVAWLMGSIFASTRAYLQAKGGVLSDLLLCQVCLSYHVSFWFSVLVGLSYWLEGELGFALRIPVIAFAAAGIASRLYASRWMGAFNPQQPQMPQHQPPHFPPQQHFNPNLPPHMQPGFQPGMQPGQPCQGCAAKAAAAAALANAQPPANQIQHAPVPRPVPTSGQTGQPTQPDVMITDPKTYIVKPCKPGDPDKTCAQAADKVVKAINEAVSNVSFLDGKGPEFKLDNK